MQHRTYRRMLATAAIWLAFTASIAGAQTPLGSEFVYQGALRQDGASVNDTADFEFTLWDAETGGAAIGAVVAMDDVLVVDGVFSVELDFGVMAFNGDARWLEVAVRTPHDPSDTQAFTTLAPRQPLTATPYALQTRGIYVDDAGNVGVGTSAPTTQLDVNGAITATQLNVGGAVTATTFVGDGSGLTNVVADRLWTPPLVSWGNDAEGQVSDTPTEGAYVAVSAGLDFTLAITGDGSLVAWGDEGRYDVDYPFPDFGTFVAVSAGYSHGLAIHENGWLEGFGNDGFFNDHIDVPGGTFISVGAGGLFSTAVRSDGVVLSWGNDDFGQVSGSPTTGTYVAVAAGYDFAVALAADGSLVSWGNDSNGQVTNTPAGNDFVAVSAGYSHAVAIRDNGSLVSWGQNTANVVAGTPTDGPYASVSAGYGFTVALRADGHIAEWGRDSDGQVSQTPIRSQHCTAIAAGYEHAIAIFDANETDTQVVDGAFGVGRYPFSNELEVEGDASKSTAGAWLANSDRRIKRAIEPVTNALGTLDKVRLVSFEYTDDYRAGHTGVGGGRYLNVIAQEFAEIFPDHVKGSGEMLPDGSEILQVDTYPLTIYSAAAIQELHQQLRAKDAEIKSQRERNDASIEALNERIARLESLVAELSTK